MRFGRGKPGMERRMLEKFAAGQGRSDEGPKVDVDFGRRGGDSIKVH